MARGKKTEDGVKICNIVKATKSLDDVIIREGASHDYILIVDSHPPYPLNTSTNLKGRLCPWLANLLGYDRQKLYECLRRGKPYKGE